MSMYESFTITKRSTGLGDLYDYIVRGPNGAEFRGTNGHVCLNQAMYAATHSLTRPLCFDGMEDGSEPVHKCSIKRGSPWPSEFHVHTHVIGKPKVGKVYGSKADRRAS